jgi:hypothetical protein
MAGAPEVAMPDEYRAFQENQTVMAIGGGLMFLGSLAAVVCGVIGLVLKARQTGDHRAYARWARNLGAAVVLLSVLGAASGLIHTFAAIGAQGLSESDKERIRANGIAESLYNLMGALVTGGPGLVLGFLGRGSMSSPDTAREPRP